ncbi:MAG: TonB-dependent receptor [Opitutaceae bacterium]
MKPCFSARLIVTAVCLSAGFSPAHAQQVVELERLEVTSQKRTQTIEDVPIAVTAYSGGSLRKLGVTDLKSLAPFVPGAFIQEQSPNNPGINIRGITTDSGDPRSETRVSLFQDGISISRSRASVVELFDLERVEVLKGPQGTLFGRGAEVGAVSIIQNKAKNERHHELALGFGNHGERVVEGVANQILSPNSLYGRVAFVAREREGTIDNVADGSDLNGKHTRALRGSLRWQAGPATTVDLIVNWQRDEPPGVAFKSGTIAPTGGTTDPFTFAELNRGRGLYVDRTVWGATLLVEHDLSPAWSLTSTTGWREYDSMEEFDADGARIHLLEFAEDAQGRQFSQELRFNYDLGRRLTGFAGVSYFYEDGVQRVPFHGDERALWPFLSGQFRSGLIAAGVPSALANFALPTVNPFVPQTNLPATLAAFANPALPPSIQGLALLANAPLKAVQEEEYRADGKTSAIEVFLDGTYRVTDAFELSAGLRFTHEELTSGYRVINSATPSTIGFILSASPNVAFAPTNGQRESSDTYTSVVGRLVGRYTFSPSLNAYASIARGRRPNSIVVDATQTTFLDEETMWNYEVGLKGLWLDKRVSWNAAAFTYDYSNFQTTIIDPTNPGRFIPSDGGNATGRGFEVALQGAVTRDLTVFTSYGFTDATFDDTGDNGQRQQFAGNSFRLTAKHTLALGARYDFDLGNLGRFHLSPVFQYKSKHYFEDNNANFGGSLSQGAFGLVNLRFGWRSSSDRYELSAYVDNLLDKNYLVDAGNIGGNFGIPTFIAGSPRFWGVSGAVRF